MSAEIVNLRQARKRKARAEKDARADENRILFGRTKAERKQTEFERRRDRAELDGKRREDADGGD